MRPLLLALALFAASGSFDAQRARARTSLGVAPDSKPDPYRFAAAQPGVWEGGNPSQGLSSRVDLESVELRVDGAGDLSVRVRTTTVGRGAEHLVAPRLAIDARARRVVVKREVFEESYVNRSEGLELGWTVHRRPMGTGLLAIRLNFEGALALRIEDGFRSGVLVSGRDEPVARVTKLVARDADERVLRARMQSGPLGVSIQVDDEAANYPITVTSLVAGAAWTADSNQAGAAFGSAVSTAGDVNADGYSDVIVSAPLYDGAEPDQGRVALYLGSSSGPSLEPSWVFDGEQASERLGSALALAGDVNGDGFSDVVVGSPHFDTPEEVDAGRVLVFHGSSEGLSDRPNLVLFGGQGSALFGSSLSTADDVNADGFSDVIVGAPAHDGGELDEGRVFLFLGSPLGLVSAETWTMEADQAGAAFGGSVSTAGDLDGDGFGDVVVGAALFDGTFQDSGRIFVFFGGGTGWRGSESINPFEGLDRQFGFSVAVLGDPEADGSSSIVASTRASRVYRVRWASGALVPSLFLSGRSGGPVAPAGDIHGNGGSHMIVGWPKSDAARIGSTVYSAVRMFAAPQPGSLFGTSVSLAGDVNGDGYSDVLIGAPGFDDGELDEGRVYVHFGFAPGFPSLGGLSGNRITEGVSGDSFADRVVAADFNADGFSDVVIRSWRRPFSDKSFKLYWGSSSGLDTEPAWVFEPPCSTADCPEDLEAIGDVNGDGYPDLVITGWPTDRVFYGSPTGFGAQVPWGPSKYPFSVTAVGDVNGDGYADVVAKGNHFTFAPPTRPEGLFLGSPSGLSLEPVQTFDPPLEMSTCGDVNGDGLGDAIARMPSGDVLVFHGTPSGLESEPSWSAPVGTFTGRGVGDINGDGFSDVVLGEPYFEEVDSEGRIRLFLGSHTGLGSSASTEVVGRVGEALGYYVAAVGDVNGDGFADVIASDDDLYSSRSHLFLGASTGLTAARYRSFDGNRFPGPADFNGDGLADVGIGNPGEDVVVPSPRPGYFFAHNSGMPRGRAESAASVVSGIRQDVADGTKPLQRFGLVANDPGVFLVRASVIAPLANWATPQVPRAFLEWEVKPVGVPFDGMNLQRGTVGASVPPFGSSSEIADLVRGASSGTAIRWRARFAFEGASTRPKSPWFSMPYATVGDAMSRPPVTSAPRRVNSSQSALGRTRLGVER